jgi:hypothetical protein
MPKVEEKFVTMVFEAEVVVPENVAELMQKENATIQLTHSVDVDPNWRYRINASGYWYRRL